MKKLFTLLALALTACAPRPNYLTFTGFQQGTTYSITVRDAPKNTEAEIDTLFRRIDLTFSMFNPTSLVSRINRNETTEITPLFEECFLLAEQIHHDTEGFYDPTVKPLVDAWGFGPEEMQNEPRLDSLLEFVGLDKIALKGDRIVKTDPRVQLDFSSIAKGFTVDKLAEMLGETDFLVEVGGEIRARGVNRRGIAWRVQIDSPGGGFAHAQAAVISLGGEGDEGGSAKRGDAVATSGNYRNRFEDAGGLTRVHTIDPHTGAMAAGDVLSASVVASSCALADGWATALVAARERGTAERLLARAPQLEWYLIYGDGVRNSPDFPLE